MDWLAHFRDSALAWRQDNPNRHVVEAVMATASGDVWVSRADAPLSPQVQLSRLGGEGTAEVTFGLEPVQTPYLRASSPEGEAVIITVQPGRTCLITAAGRVVACPRDLAFSPDGTRILEVAGRRVRLFRWEEPAGRAAAGPRDNSHSDPSPCSGLTLHGLTLGMDQARVLAVAGEPASRFDWEGATNWDYPDRGLALTLRSDRVVTVFAGQGGFPSGLAVGDPVGRATALFGEPISDLDFEAVKWWDLAPCEMWLKVDVKDGLVDGLMLTEPFPDFD